MIELLRWLGVGSSLLMGFLIGRCPCSVLLKCHREIYLAASVFNFLLPFLTGAFS